MKTASKNYQIIINKPCSADWQSMAISERGSFCKECSINVVDFTKSSEEEIKNYFFANIGKRTCGRFSSDQVQKAEVKIDVSLIKSRMPKWKKFLLIFLLVFGDQFTNANFILANSIKIENVNILDSEKKSKLDKEVLDDDQISSEEITMVIMGDFHYCEKDPSLSIFKEEISTFNIEEEIAKLTNNQKKEGDLPDQEDNFPSQNWANLPVTTANRKRKKINLG